MKTNPYIATRIGKYMLARRKELGMSMRHLAREVGISPAYVSSLEKCSNPKTGKPSTPSYDVLQRLSRVLGNEILSFTDVTNDCTDPLKSRFDQLVIDAFYSGTEELLSRSRETIETMKRNVLEEAEISYRELSGTALSAYIEKLKNHDYMVEFIRTLGDYREKYRT